MSWLVSWLVMWLFRWLVCWKVSELVSYLVSQLVCWLACWLASAGGEGTGSAGRTEKDLVQINPPTLGVEASKGFILESKYREIFDTWRFLEL